MESSQYKNVKALKILEKSLVFLNENNKCIVYDIINNINDSVVSYERGNLVSLNPTKKESCLASSSLLKRIRHIYLNECKQRLSVLKVDTEIDICEKCKLKNKELIDLYGYYDESNLCLECNKKQLRVNKINSSYYNTHDRLVKEIRNRVKNHVISEDNTASTILLCRECKSCDRTPLQQELAMYILLNIQKDFEEENPKLSIELDDIITKQINKFKI